MAGTGRLPAMTTGPAALRGSSLLLGVAVLALAAGVAATDLGAADILDWLADTLGTTFLTLLGLLCGVAFWAWVRIVQNHPRRDFWLEAGLHAAAAVATLALTFTLLGISLGIGTLAHTELTPETVQPVIADLTEQFSLAFMTSVIGLPVSAGLRAALLLTDSAASPPDLPDPDESA
ncbi:hypothetical protein [Pacificispira sp.]|uniref:hypothetical protein n=1 Tax=Pacificispira sp. TaxID=2888761 RepID=UPI003B52BEA2